MLASDGSDVDISKGLVAVDDRWEEFSRPVNTSSSVPPKVSKGIKSSVFTYYSWQENIMRATQ